MQGREHVLLAGGALCEARVEADDIAGGLVGGKGDGEHVGGHVPVDTLGARRGSQGSRVAMGFRKLVKKKNRGFCGCRKKIIKRGGGGG